MTRKDYVITELEAALEREWHDYLARTFTTDVRWPPLNAWAWDYDPLVLALPN